MSADIAVVVNLRARRASEAVARACRRELPNARVLASRTLDEAVGFAHGFDATPPDVVVSGGGDGTAVALINALRGRPSAGATIACLRLGTGNGWARDMGAPDWQHAIKQLGEWRGGPASLPRKRFDLIDVDGTITHFAGTGWDAEIIDDFYAQKQGVGVIPRAWRNGLAGYLHGMIGRTIPRYLLGRRTRAEVELVNTGDTAIGVDDLGRPIPLEKYGPGAVLYRGPISVCGAGTTHQWGFEFKSFPFAGLVRRRFCLRAYTAPPITAVRYSRDLWRGKHPIPHMHTWLLTGCRATFSQPVPFQIGGDRVGWKDVIDYKIAEEQVDLLEWRRMS
jgi:hypothetical protein